MKPNVVELNLTGDEHNALLADLAKLASTDLLKPRADGRQDPALNSGAVSLFLAEVVAKHLPPKVREALAHVKDEGTPPIIILGNLPTSEAAEERHVANADLVSTYLLRGLATLLDHDPAQPVAKAARKDIEISKVAAPPMRPDRGLGYHRDGVSVLQAQRAGRPYKTVPIQYSMLLCERENVHAATYFIDPDNPHIRYFQDVAKSDEQATLEARPVVLRAGQLCVFRNNDLLHGRIAAPPAEPGRERLLTSALVTPSLQKYASPPEAAPDSLEARFARAVEAAGKEIQSAPARG